MGEDSKVVPILGGKKSPRDPEPSKQFLAPAMLEEYERLFPGSAKVLLDSWRKEVEHRRKLEVRGQLFGFSLALICILGSLALVGLGYSIEGVSLVFGSITALVGVFLWTQREDRKRNE